MDQSPMLPEQSHSAGTHWVRSSDEYFPTYVPTSRPGSTAFTYGSWEEWMRWDGVAESLSPSQLQISPPAYRRNKLVSSAQQEPMMSPGITGPENSVLETQGSMDQVPISAMDISPFAFGYNDNNQTDYRFSEAMTAARGQPSPQDHGFHPEIVSWDTPPQVSPMTMDDHQHLRNMAFQRTSSYGSHQSLGSTSEVNRAGSASPEPPQSNSTGKKRKSSGEDSIRQAVANTTGTEPPIKKTAHNMIEKRYRTNLNDKISALRDSVPSLRAMPETAPGTIPAHKINKSVVLSKATEYIQHLTQKNQRLEDENSALRARIRAFEKLAIAGSIGPNVTAGGTPIPPRIQGPPFADGGNENNHLGTPEHEENQRRALPTSLRRPNWLSQLPARSLSRD